MKTRKLADIPPEEIREWLRKLEEAGISPWTLVHAHAALCAVEDAKGTRADDPEIGDDWDWWDELCASCDADLDDPRDGIIDFNESALEVGAHLGLPVKED